MLDILITISLTLLIVGGLIFCISTFVFFKSRSRKSVKTTWYKEPQIISAIGTSMFFIEGFYVLLLLNKVISLSILTFVPTVILPLGCITLSIISLKLQPRKPSRT
jgi:hypothetical protein